MADEVRAKRFVVVDDQGNERAILGMGSNGISLELRTAGADRPAVALQLADSGDVCLTMIRDEQTAEIRLSRQNASVRLTQTTDPKSSCAMILDEAGAWVVAEVTRDIGVRILCRNDGTATSVWLSETYCEGDETCVRTRFVRPDPADDKAGAWRMSR